jgi:hypothetical protein
LPRLRGAASELALIRWTAANNIHLAYPTNFVLIASFLGIGIGFLRTDDPPDSRRSAGRGRRRDGRCRR